MKDRVMDELLNAGRKITYKKGEILIRPSDNGGELVIISQGLIHAYTIEETGEKNIHFIYGPGEVFPLSWIIKKNPLSVYYEAISACVVIKISIDEAIKLLKSESSISFTMLEQVLKQFIAYMARVDNLEYKFARERIAYRLLLLGKRFGEEKDGIIILPRFSQEEFGNTTNVSRESVGRELKRFEKLGLIKYEASKIKILDKHGLHKEIAPADTPLFIDSM